MDFIDLFAGIGGFRLGLESVGFQCVFSSEIDKYARQTYKANFKEEPYGDITKIASENIPAHDVLCAGFPCQPFSIAGKRLGVKDSRGNLFDEIVRIAKYHKPRILFLENVPGLLSQDKGKTFEGMVQKLRDIGYCINYKTLNAKDFGVPQNRKRVYIIATLKKSKFDFPEPLGISTKVKDILEELVDDKYFISDKAWKGHQDRKKKHLEKGNGFGFSLFNNDSRFTSTISARYYKDGSEILIEQENKNPRRLTPQEVARLQGFPDSFSNNSFVFCDTRNGPTTIHSWDIRKTTDREKYICLTILKNRRKKIYGKADGNPIDFKDLCYLIPKLKASELNKLVKKNILKYNDHSYEFVNSKNSSGINGIYRIYMLNAKGFSTLTATGTNDMIALRYISGNTPEELKKDFIKNIYKKKLFRPVTPQEVVRLQGFPDSFVIPVSDTQAYKQFGNAVCVNVVSEIAKKIKGFCNGDKTR